MVARDTARGEEDNVEDTDRPLWPALVTIFLQAASAAMMIPYVSIIAATAPYSLKVPVECTYHECDGDAGIPVTPEEAIVRAQTIVSASQSVQAFFELFSAGILGVLCDRIGPKPVAVVSQLGHLIMLAILMFCTEANGYLDIQIHRIFLALILGNAIAGICGQLKISVQAYVARVSTPETSARNFGRMAACVGLAFCIGPLLNIVIGQIFDRRKARIPLFFACMMNVASLLVICCAWPQMNRCSQASRTAPWSNALPCLLFKSTLLATTPLMMYSAIFFVDGFGTDMVRSGFMVFARKVFHFGTQELSAFMMFHGVLAPIMMSVVLPRLLKWFGELFVLKVGSGAVLTGFVVAFLVGLQSAGWLLFIVPPISAVGMMMNPVLMGMACRELPKEGMGRLSGALNLVETVAKFVAPLVAGYVMSRTLRGPTPSLVFLAAAAIATPGVSMAWCVRPKDPLSADESQSESEESQDDSSQDDSSAE
mmetsp:Transcript_28047/g.89128  ORF Transcript_28047/g.89128 Transcript_28047/m.89128 type:complete len:482 (-) Transcript_28047:225-1670(-)